ncbi:hypothetical protein LSTR_LSTR011151 [Laodelphax striatellus]|uniref:BPL/LPL catalytic domain-containing protein n=1 Tax=Laodelphax striatellus TaxID=195883 RepID=A0A482XL01_LAOST|nr:hypothetical protein LSTR_LSTR011151 [Laodelphax striatellus]
MLLTLYYFAATWLQSWRLNSIKTKISEIRERNGSVLLYKDPSSKSADSGGHASATKLDATASEDEKKPLPKSRSELPIRGVIESKFIPEGKSQVGDLLWFASNKFSISLFPIPVVDICDWISVPGGRTTFPIPLKNCLQSPLSSATRVHLLFEAEFCAFEKQAYSFHVEEFGAAKAWYAGESFSLLLETDEDHLARLMAGFMLNTIHISSGLEIVRIQSVEVTGTPCFFLNTDWENLPKSATKKLGISRRWMTAPQWNSHVVVLRSFSQAAVKAVKTQDPVSIEGQKGSVLVRGPSPIAVTSPTSFGDRDQQQSLSLQLAVDEKLSRAVGEVCLSPSVSMSVQHGSNSVDPSSASVSSFGSMTRLSNDTLVAASPLRKSLLDGRSGSMTSIGSMSTASVCSNVQQRVVVPHQKTSSDSPPNVFIFSESSVSVESVKMTLSAILHKQRYTVYPLNLTQMLTTPWQTQASLVVISGSVPASLVPRLVSFVLRGGGRLLCLCSDLLGTFLPPFRTAEVRPDELVTFSYSTWKHVSLMHHIFCYQPSPTPAKFSQDEQSIRSGIPNSVEIQDTDKKQHTLDVKVLGAEETWQTPSLILATTQNGGKIIFSQVHLEVDPLQYENDEAKHKALRSSDKARVEILIDLLSTHLGLKCGKQGPDPKYTPAYFLGTHELKLEFMESLKGSMDDSNTLKLAEIMVKFCGKSVTSPPEASSTFMPVLMYACPDSFSTVIYFENLNTKKLGRLVIYSKVMVSAALLLDGRKLAHGLAVIPYTQTESLSNSWLSPDGCATFSLQLHIPVDSLLGQNLTLLQHLVTIATVSSICSIPGLENLDICLKWPNDIYAGKSLKIGASTLRCIVHNLLGICNVSLGLNLSNKEPTTCVNDMIAELNRKTGKSVAALSHEKLFAIVFTELERLVEMAQSGHIDDVIAIYYKYWLHSNAEATVIGADGCTKSVQIVGIDYLGALRVQDQSNDEFALHPDEYSFDMQSAIIAPKV